MATLTRENLRLVLVRSKARKFAAMVKESNMAHKVPDEIIDWLKDDDIPHFFTYLFDFGLTRRADHLWERK